MATPTTTTSTTKNQPWHPSTHPASKTALLLLDYEKAHVNLISDRETRERVVQSTKRLLTAARESGVAAILHCLVDTDSDPPPTSRGNEMWHSVVKPMIRQDPGIVAEYEDFAIENMDDNTNSHSSSSSSSSPVATRETTSRRNPAHLSALTDEAALRLLRDELGVTHLVMSGITTSGPVLGTATHALDLDFVVTVVRDACWDPDGDVHRALLDKVLPVLAYVEGVDEAVGYMSG